MAKNDAAIDRAVAALNRAAGALASLPGTLKRVEYTSNAEHLVPPFGGGKAFLSRTPQVVTGGRRWKQLRDLQARRAAATGGIRDTWKGAIAGQIYGQFKRAFAHLDAKITPPVVT